MMRISAACNGTGPRAAAMDTDGHIPSGGVAIAVDGVDTGNVFVGDIVWRSRDSLLESRLRASYDKVASKDLRRGAVHARVVGAVGSPVTLHLQVRCSPVRRVSL